MLTLSFDSRFSISPKVFGYKVVELEKKGSFILVNLLDLSTVFKDTILVPFQPLESSLLFLRTNILVVILMSGGTLNEGIYLIRFKCLSLLLGNLISLFFG